MSDEEKAKTTNILKNLKNIKLFSKILFIVGYIVKILLSFNEREPDHFLNLIGLLPRSILQLCIGLCLIDVISAVVSMLMQITEDVRKTVCNKENSDQK